jgi:undecaprenyl-diphosphatase
MEMWQAVVLAVLQGLTEFLPISSSAHLILPSEVFGWPDQGLAFDVAVHVGSLSAVLYYFRADIGAMVAAWFRQVAGGPASEDSRMAWYIIVATLPAGLCGVLLDGWIETNLRSMAVIASATIGFGLLLGWADRGGRERGAAVTLQTAVAVGLAQAGLMLGLSRQQASRFSFLLSIPLILAAGLLKTVQLLAQGAAAPWGFIAMGAALSGVTAYLCIRWFMRWVERVGFMPFVIYRVLLGLALFGLMAVR